MQGRGAQGEAQEKPAARKAWRGGGARGRAEGGARERGGQRSRGALEPADKFVGSAEAIQMASTFQYARLVFSGCVLGSYL